MLNMSSIYTLNERENYCKGLLKDSYSPLSYRILEPGKSDYINNSIAMSLTKLIQPHMIKTTLEKMVMLDYLKFLIIIPYKNPS